MIQMINCGYSAPVCITLVGGNAPFEPALMCAHPQRVKVSVEMRESSQVLPSSLTRIAQCYSQMYPEDSDVHYTWHVEIPIDVNEDHDGVQSALIATYCACRRQIATGAPASISDVQKMAYQIEKKLFKLSSHCQTTTSLVGGLVFYRKEFEFHKTVFKIPAHIPKAFALDTSLSPKKHGKIETRIRRIIFAIMQENERMFNDSFDRALSNIPASWALQEDREGLVVWAKTS